MNVTVPQMYFAYRNNASLAGGLLVVSYSAGGALLVAGRWRWVAGGGGLLVVTGCWWWVAGVVLLMVGC